MKTGQLIKPLQRLYKRRVDSSVLLFLAAVAAVIIANIPSVSGLYNQLLQYPIMVQIGEFNIFSHAGETMTLLDFTNDVLMVLFFLQVGLEIKQEGLVGELSTVRRAVFPVIGAMGGMIMPVLFFLLVCHQAPASNGMAIPMSTDIAFALAVLSLLGKRVPSSLKAFLASLAVADDIGGILVIAIFYSTHLNLMMLLWAAVCLGVIYLLGRLGVRNLLVYYIGAFVVWTFFLKSGVHTTIAGVLVAFLVPARPKLSTDHMADRMRTMLRLLPESEHKTKGKNVLLPHQQIAVVQSMARDVRGAVSPVQRMEQQITPIVHFIVLPLFAFVNAGVAFGGVSMESLVGVPLAIVLGLLLGKPLGIFLFSIVFAKVSKGGLPQGMTTKNLLALSCLGGIGFTVALFISSLSYAQPEVAHFLNDAKIGIFAGSILSGVLGYFFLKAVLKHEHHG